MNIKLGIRVGSGGAGGGALLVIALLDEDGVFLLDESGEPLLEG
jgi:hypothetical protein